MKDLSVLTLMDIYGDALTDRQRQMLADYYERDFSLSEIADNCGVSRQAVHFSIKQAEDGLAYYESKFGVCAFVSELCKRLAAIESEPTSEKVEEIEEFIRSKYGTVR